MFEIVLSVCTEHFKAFLIHCVEQNCARVQQANLQPHKNNEWLESYLLFWGLSQKFLSADEPAINKRKSKNSFNPLWSVCSHQKSSKCETQALRYFDKVILIIRNFCRSIIVAFQNLFETQQWWVFLNSNCRL